MLPAHITLMVLIEAGYCILLTPARSAAAYAHHVHRKAIIVGLKSSDTINPVKVPYHAAIAFLICE
jgi:hypothetical protein